MKHHKSKQPSRQSGKPVSKRAAKLAARKTEKPAKAPSTARKPAAKPAKKATWKSAAKPAAKVASKQANKQAKKQLPKQATAPPVVGKEQLRPSVPSNPLRPHVGPHYVDPIDYPTHPYPSMKCFAEHLALGNSMPRARHCYYRDLRLVNEVRRLLGYPRPHHRRPRMFPRCSSGQFSQQGDDESIRCVGEGGLHILTQCHERGSCGREGNAHVHARLHDHQRHESGAADEAQGHGAGIHQRSLQPQCVDFGNVPRRGCLKIRAAANNDRQARLGANPGGQREGDGIRYRCRSQLGTASGRLRWSI